LENSLTAQIGNLLGSGKTVKEIVEMGYKPRTVYHVQSRLKKEDLKHDSFIIILLRI